MTISQYIARFIKEYENIKIETNHVQDGADRYGLFKSPSREVDKNIDGSMKITEYYQFFAKQVAVSEADRADSDEWLEEFTYWLDDFDMIYEYPAIDGNRQIVDISASGCPTPFEDNDGEILYQISLTVTYMRYIE